LYYETKGNALFIQFYRERNSQKGVDTAAYILKSPELLSAFEAEVRVAGLSYDYKVTIDKEAHKRTIGFAMGMAKKYLMKKLLTHRSNYE